MSSGRKASLRPRRRSSGKIKLPVTTPQATKLKTMLTKKQICARMTDPHLAVRDARVALPNLYNVTVGIPNVTARLAVFGLRLSDELGASTFPKFVTRLNIRNTDI